MSDTDATTRGTAGERRAAGAREEDSAEMRADVASLCCRMMAGEMPECCRRWTSAQTGEPAANEAAEPAE